MATAHPEPMAQVSLEDKNIFSVSASMIDSFVLPTAKKQTNVLTISNECPKISKKVEGNNHS